MFPWECEKRNRITVNLHDMSVSEAKKWLEAKVSGAPRDTEEIEVIHGYHGGTALQNMVRKSFHHPRVKRKILGLNQGSTILILKE